MLIVVLLLTAVLPLAAAWERRILTPKGERIDTPEPHPLSYFTRYPWLRDEDNGLCYLCSPEKKLAAAKARKARADVRLVGKISGYPIYDVLYYFDEESAPQWKSILVRTQPGRYREIWHYQKNEGGIWPSFLVKIGEDALLGVHDDCYRQQTIQEYFWFTRDGVVRVDLSPIWMAAGSDLPKNTVVWRGLDGRVDLPAGQMRVGLITEPDLRCCSPGAVEVNFTFNAGQIVVNSKRLLQGMEFEWGHGCR